MLGQLEFQEGRRYKLESNAIAMLMRCWTAVVCIVSFSVAMGCEDSVREVSGTRESNSAGNDLEDRKLHGDESAKLDRLATRFGIEIITTQPVFPVHLGLGVIDGKEADRSRVAAYSRVFVEEFGLYPPELVRRAKLERIVFCANLSYKSQVRNGVPDFQRQTLYLEVERGRYNHSYLRWVLHHEFFHMIDYAYGNNIYNDELWTALNVHGTEYRVGGGAAAQSSPNERLLDDQFPGFLNRYSMSGVEEDKAEVFAALICEPEYCAQRMGSDSVIRAKISHIKSMLHSVSADAGDQLWASARTLRMEVR